MWTRVFLRSSDPISPLKLVKHLADIGYSVTPHFKGDDIGWTSGELHLDGRIIALECYHTREDDIRDELNAFAAELETHDGNRLSAALMERVIQTQQLIALRSPVLFIDDCCRFLSREGDGVYQIDGRGWFDADGTLLLTEHLSEHAKP